MEKLEGHGRTSRNAMDSSPTQYIKERVAFWIKKLTVHPCTFNKGFGDSGIKDNDSMIGQNFPSLHRNSSQKTRGIKHININKIIGKYFLCKLNKQLFNNLPNIKNYIRINIASLNKISLKEIPYVINDRLNFPSKAFKYCQW